MSEFQDNLDPHDLSRYVVAQQDVYEQALAEIRDGAKRSHWMWFIFPQFVGLGFSPPSKRFAIKSIAEAEAYLGHGVLGPRLLQCFEALMGIEGRSAAEVFGSPDDMKLRSCATLFAALAPPGAVFDRALDKFFGGNRCEKTISLVSPNAEAPLGNPMDEEPHAPALHISHIVCGREHRDGKVYYFLDADCSGSEKGIPEQVVLWRWRHRKNPAGYRFGGDRLSPNVWRAMAVAFPDGSGISADATLENLRDAGEAARGELRARHYSLPSAECVQAMFRGIGPKRVKELIARHTSPERADKYGTPDLFLYMTPIASSQPPVIRFVEVKKPHERIRPDQKEEIAHLRSIGIPARVLRLIERDRPNPIRR